MAKRFIKYSKYNSGYLAFEFLILKELSRINGYLKRTQSPLLTPVPMHWLRLFNRGYNQTEIITSLIAKETKIECSYDLIFKSKATKSQTKVRKNVRQINIKDSFKVNLRELSKYIEKDIVVIDDVRTTASTLNEIAGTIKEHSPKSRVHGLTLFSPNPKLSNKMFIPNRNR